MNDITVENAAFLAYEDAAARWVSRQFGHDASKITSVNFFVVRTEDLEVEVTTSDQERNYHLIPIDEVENIIRTLVAIATGLTEEDDG